MQLLVETLAIGHSRQRIGAGFAPRAVQLLGLLFHAEPRVGQVVLELLIGVEHRGDLGQQRLLHLAHRAIDLQPGQVPVHGLNFRIVGADLLVQLLGGSQHVGQDVERRRLLAFVALIGPLLLRPGSQAQVKPDPHADHDAGEHHGSTLSSVPTANCSSDDEPDGGMGLARSTRSAAQRCRPAESGSISKS